MPITTYADPTNISGVVGTFDYANSITGEAFVPIIIFVIWIILFITLKQWRTEAALTSSLFSTMLITIILRTANLVTDLVLMVTVIAFLASVFLMVFNKEEGG